MSTVLPAEDLLMEIPMDSSPFVRVIAVGGAGATRMSATSPSATVDVPAGTTSFSKAAVVVAAALTVTG